MQTITPSAAILLVRKNLDEVGPNDSVMYTDENSDNLSLSDIIKKNLPEAINAVHLAAPVQLLDGEEVSSSASVSVSTDGVLSISLPSSVKFLRLVSFLASDSQIKVTDAIPAASPEGRKQLNPYIRGRADRPRLVLVSQGGSSTGPSFKYYSITNPQSGSVAEFNIIEEQIFAEATASYNISRRLRQNIIDYLTGLVMETYSDQRAQFFFDKANNYPII